MLASVADTLKIFEYDNGNDPALRLSATCDGLGDDLTSLSWNHTNVVIGK